MSQTCNACPFLIDEIQVLCYNMSRRCLQCTFRRRVWRPRSKKYADAVICVQVTQLS